MIDTRNLLAPKLLAAGVAVLALAGASACSNAQKTEAQQEETVGDGSTDAGAQIQEEATQVGEAIEAGAKEVAQEVDQATDKLAAEAREAQADTAAEASQDNAGKR